MGEFLKILEVRIIEIIIVTLGVCSSFQILFVCFTQFQNM